MRGQTPGMTVVFVGPKTHHKPAVVPRTFRAPGDHDWKVNGKCRKCKRPVYTMRRDRDFGIQRDEKCRCDVREVQHAT